MNAEAVIDELVQPLVECLTPEAAKRVLALKADAALQKKMDRFADRHSQGLLSADEKAVYCSLVEYSTFVAILKAKVRQMLANGQIGD